MYAGIKHLYVNMPATFIQSGLNEEPLRTSTSAGTTTNKMDPPAAT